MLENVGMVRNVCRIGERKRRNGLMKHGKSGDVLLTGKERERERERLGFGLGVSVFDLV